MGTPATELSKGTWGLELKPPGAVIITGILTKGNGDAFFIPNECWLPITALVIWDNYTDTPKSTRAGNPYFEGEQNMGMSDA